MEDLTARALRAVAGVAELVGLHEVAPRTVSSGMNEIVALDPYPVVARVMGHTGVVRTSERMAESLAVARFMDRRGVPVTRPAVDVDPGPHESGGMSMTLWEAIEVQADGGADPESAGAALRMLHDAGADCPVPASGHTPATEVRRLVTLQPDVPEMRRIGELIDRVPVIDLPEIWVHGDAHLANFLVTNAGGIWADWEECWFGPAAWDLACLLQRKTVFGEIPRETDAALAAYGRFDTEVVTAMMPLVTLWIAAWGTAIAPSERSAFRVHWAEEQLGG